LESREGENVKTAAVIGAFDTKGKEFAYLLQKLKEEGLNPLTVDVGVLGEPEFIPDVSASEVVEAAGENLARIRRKGGRKEANDVMMREVRAVIQALYKEGKIDGAVSMGGGQGTHVAAAAMSVLPVGFPKVILSTVATVGHAQSHFQNINDTMVMNSLVDIQGLNYISCTVIEETAAALAGLMNRRQGLKSKTKKRIAMSMFGITTPCAGRAQNILEKNGFEVLVFHATGMGGKIMEKIIDEGMVQGVLDLTLGELVAEMFHLPGGAGTNRLRTAGKKGIPQIVVPGALDVLNFMPPETMPEKYEGRTFLMHNMDVKVIRTNEEENRMLAREVAKRLNGARGKTIVVLPKKGISENDKAEKEFHSPSTNQVLFDTLKEQLNPQIEIAELDCHINDPQFADYIAARLMEEAL